MIDNDRASLSREDRDELAAMAAAASRRNRPTHLVAAACVLLVGAAAMAGSALLSRQSAERALIRATSENVRASAIIDELTRIRAERGGAGAAGGARENEPFPNFGSTMSTLATQSGLTVGIPQEQSRPSGAFVRREYAYSLSAPSLDPVMAWVRKSTDEIPGTRVISFSITPQPATSTWTVLIKFARLERTQARSTNP